MQIDADDKADIALFLATLALIKGGRQTTVINQQGPATPSPIPSEPGIIARGRIATNGSGGIIVTNEKHIINPVIFGPGLIQFDCDAGFDTTGIAVGMMNGDSALGRLIGIVENLSPDTFICRFTLADGTFPNPATTICVIHVYVIPATFP